MPFDQPVRVVSLSERQQRLSEFFDRFEGPDPEQVLLERADEPLGAAVPPGDAVALRRSVRGGGPAVFGHGAGTHDRQMAAQARADPVATAPLSSQEGRSGPAGF